VNVFEFIGELSRRWRTFAWIASGVAVLGTALIVATPTTYTSSTKLLVSIAGSTTFEAYQNDDVARERINSYIPLLTSEVVSQRVVDELRSSQSAEQLAEHVSAARVPPNTSLIDVSVSARSADDARALADAYATEFIAYTRALETPTGMGAQKVRVTQVSGASDPRSDVPVRLALGIPTALIAIVLGAAAVWIRSGSTRRRHPELAKSLKGN
jgi:capsular polysaccharide biosynthesis protein